MAGPALPINIDTTYPDSATDASQKLHQQQHDSIHGIVNQFDTANASSAGFVPVGDGSVFAARALLSTDVPGVVTNSQAGSYTLALTDAGKLVEVTAATSATVTVPPNSSVPFPIGIVVNVFQYGAGQVSVAAGTGVTVLTPASLTVRVRYAEISLRKRAADEWVVAGDLM